MSPCIRGLLVGIVDETSNDAKQGTRNEGRVCVEEITILEKIGKRGFAIPAPW